MKNILIYTTNYCPYCVKAKKLLDQEHLTYTEINIERDQAKRDELEKLSHIRTVPQIFVDGKFISDCDGLYALHRKGEFEAIFK